MSAVPDADGPDLLPAVLRRLMADVGMPAGLAEVGYTASLDPPEARGLAGTRWRT